MERQKVGDLPGDRFSEKLQKKSNCSQKPFSKSDSWSNKMTYT